MSSESDFQSCSESDGESADGGGAPPPLPSRDTDAPPPLPPHTGGAFASGVGGGGDDSSDDDGPPIVPSRDVKVVNRTFVEPSGINYAPFEMMQALDTDAGSMMFADHCWGQPPSTEFSVRGASYAT
jgi:hypothetical protein